MKNAVYVIACNNALGEMIFAKFEQNPERNRILSPFGAESPLNAAHFINERNARYAMEQTPNLIKPRVLKMWPCLQEVA
jgi:hypothetical protein